MLSVSVYFPIFIIYIFVISCDGRMIEVQRDLPVVKDTSSIDRYWKDVMAFNKTKPLLTKYLQGNLGPKLVSSALSNALSSKVMSDNGAKNGNPSARSLDFRRTPEQGNSVGQILTFSRRRGEGFGDFGSSGQERFWTGGFNAGEVAGADGGERGGMVHFRGQGATLDGAVAGGRARGQNGGRAGGGVGAAKAAAGAASGAGTAAEDGIKSQSSANSQAASQSSKGKSQAMAASSANSQAANGDSAAVSNSQSMAASSSDTANSQSQAMSASMSAANGQSSSSQSAAFAAASSAALGQAMAASQAMSSSASFSAGSQAMSASSSQSAATGGANNNAFSSSSSMSMASSNLEGAEAGNNHFKMNFRTPFGTTNVEEEMKIPIMTWKEQFSRWSRKKLNKKRLIQF